MLLIDISHSMILYGEDRITPAKQVALALTELILTRYPKDTLRVGTFGDEAREIAIKDIPYLQVGPFHTNTRAGLEMAQTILEGTRQSNRQIFMVTDGKPTAITENGEVYKNPYGFDPKILAQTLEAALGLPPGRHHHHDLHAGAGPRARGFRGRDDAPESGTRVLRVGGQAGRVPLCRLHPQQEARRALREGGPRGYRARRYRASRGCHTVCADATATSDLPSPWLTYTPCPKLGVAAPASGSRAGHTFCP